MARTLTATQQTNVEADATRPIYLVEWLHSGTIEYLSVNGEVTYGGQAYTPGELRINQIIDSDVATISMPATATRVAEVTSQVWRDRSCVIRLIPGAPGDSGTYTASPDAALVVMDGIIQTSVFAGNRITVTVKNKYFTGALCPRLRLDQVAHHIPPVGTVQELDGTSYDYAQWYKTTGNIQQITRPGITPTVKGRPSSAEINQGADPLQNTGNKPISGEGVYLPIVYGRAAVEGYVIADADYAGARVVGVAWCLGEVYEIESVWINDTNAADLGITIVNYRGTSTQTPDNALENLIPGYIDDLIYHFGGGKVGVCYSRLSIPSSVVNDGLRLRAVIKGRLVADPTTSPQSTDPYSSNVQLDVDFTVGTTDASANAHTITLNGDAAISSPSTGLELDGTGDYASIADDPTLEVGSSAFTLEIEASTTTADSSPEVTETLFSKHTTDSPGTKAIRIDRAVDTMLLYLSSDGLNWDIANAVDAGTLSSSPLTTNFRFTLERVGNAFITTLDGRVTSNTQISDAGSPVGSVSPLPTGIFDSDAGIELGAHNGTQEWTGKIVSCRLTIGVYRYGGNHDTSNSPYSDSGTYGNKVYSTNPALCWADLAEDAYSGAGATTTNVATAAAYCDGNMGSSPEVPRAQIGLAIKTNQRVEQWLDRLAAYANCLWFPEGSDLKIVPDQASTQSPEFTATKWVRDSLQIEGQQQEQVPKMVTVTFTDPSDTSGVWETRSFTLATPAAAAE